MFFVRVYRGFQGRKLLQIMSNSNIWQPWLSLYCAMISINRWVVQAWIAFTSMSARRFTFYVFLIINKHSAAPNCLELYIYWFSKKLHILKHWSITNFIGSIIRQLGCHNSIQSHEFFCFIYFTSCKVFCTLVYKIRFTGRGVCIFGVQFLSQ